MKGKHVKTETPQEGAQISERQRPHPTGNTAVMQFMGELRKAGNLDAVIEIVGKRFEELQSRLAQKDVEIATAYGKVAHAIVSPLHRGRPAPQHF